MLQSSKYQMKQECIPVGCVPSAAVPVEGGCILACTGHERCVSQHALGREGCVSQLALGRGVSAQGVSAQGGVYWGLPESVCHTHPPVNRMTDACENITFPQLRCGW